MRKTAVITGANRGIGLGLAKALANQDYRVFMLGRDSAKIAQAANDLADATAHAVDVSDSSQVMGFAETLSQKLDHLDLLINNAGVIIEHQASIANIDPEIVLNTLNINTVGALRMTQALMPLLLRAESPRIVNVSSGMGELQDMGGGTPAYRISKTAMNAITKITAAENTHADFKVNSVCPGWVRTDLGGQHADRSIDEALPGILWAAQLGTDGPTGGFFRDGQALGW